MKTLIRKALRKADRKSVPAPVIVSAPVRGAAYTRAQFDEFRSMVEQGNITGVMIHGPILTAMALHMDRMRNGSLDDMRTLGEIINHPNQTAAVIRLRTLALA